MRRGAGSLCGLAGLYAVRAHIRVRNDQPRPSWLIGRPRTTYDAGGLHEHIVISSAGQPGTGLGLAIDHCCRALVQPGCERDTMYAYTRPAPDHNAPTRRIGRIPLRLAPVKGIPVCWDTNVHSNDVVSPSCQWQPLW